MKLKSWSPVIAGLLVSLTAASAFSQSAQTQNGTVVNVICDKQNSTFTTVAKTTVEDIVKDIPFFHWRASALPGMDPQQLQQLCKDVSKKLQSYYNDSSNDPLIHVNVRGIPKVCLDKDSTSCSQVLFTLAPSLSQTESQEILDSILDSNLRQDAPPPDPADVERGVQPRVYRVRLWQLLFN